MKELLRGLGYIAPAGTVILVFRVIPILAAFGVSFYYVMMGRIVGFAGLSQYKMLFGDPEFWNSLVNTSYFVIGTVPVSIFLSLFVAILLNQKIKALGAYRTIYFLPVVTSMVAIAMVWKWLYHPRLGLLNYLLGLVGGKPSLWLEEPKGIFAMAAGSLGISLPAWLAGPSVALVAITITNLWRGIGYNVVIFLAGLQNIPGEYYEAAKIDGAGKLQTFWKITWPLISPTTFYVLIMTTIVSFQVFTLVYLMTGPPIGGPLGTTKVLVYYIFEKGFDSGGDMGYASCVALVLFVIVLSLTLVQRRLIERRVHYY
ncbi:MAG TPA: sugar ABC transporter permease [bacterium]|nr:sugar ABC transporter permease [bacterium]